MLVPIGVGSLAAAAARYGAATGATVIGVEPETAACLTASLAAGEPVEIDDAGHDDGRPGLRGGLGGRLAVAARGHPRHDHGLRRRDARRDARARRRRAGDRRVRRRAARRAAGAARSSRGRACC